MKKLLLLEKKDRSETVEISNIAKSLNIDLTVKDLKDFHFDLSSLASIKKELENYDALWVRTYTDFSLVRIICQLFESSNKSVFGASSNDISFIQDKMADLWQLKLNDVPIPHTSSINSSEHQVIYKPYWGFGGFDIHTTNPDKPYYYQQQLINKQSDIRLYFSYDEIIPLVIQRSNLCDFRTNKHQGGTTEIYSLEEFKKIESLDSINQLCNTGKRAAIALNRKFSAIDLIKNGEEYQVLEVNRTPRIRLSSEANHLIIKTMLQDIIKNSAI